MKKNLLHIPLLIKFPLTLFIIILGFSQAFAQAQVKFGNSYVNISKKTVGGTVQPGDTLEIRTNYYFATGYNGNNIYFVRYLDNIPVKTSYIGDSLRLITNEGLTHKRWTNAVGDDPGNYVAAPAAGLYNVRINIGTGAAAPFNNAPTNTTGAGSLRVDIDRPRAGGGLLVTTAFKVRVTGSVGDTIILGAARFLYKKTNSVAAADTVVNAFQYNILISNNDPICNNAIGKNFVGEAGGTFDSGSTQNRSYGPTFLIPNYIYRNLTPALQINDGYYTIVNNLSPYASTFQNAEKRPSCITIAGGPPPVPAACANRMFGGHWDIIGDHTGTTTTTGKPPTAVGTGGGYMLVVNADYATSEAYRQSISGLCPNTSYEFSLWIKNVCTNCGIDSTGTQTFKPGVLPNLTFAIDNLDRYSSGQVDTVGWKKKGFLFKTGPAQTSITISIRNNASGGGGNDWAIDDIKLVTCNPDLTLVPTGNSNVCYGNQVDISCTVRAFFSNYVNYRWEKSINGGTTWTVEGGGTGTPVLVAGQYQYNASLPSFLADSSRHLNRYRFIVASTASNLADPNCSFTASTIIIVMVNNCLVVLNTNLIAFNGKLINDYATLHWTTENETGTTIFDIERSDDGLSYMKLGSVNGTASKGHGDTYLFRDQNPVAEKGYYRIKMREENAYLYTKIVLLSNTLEFGIGSLINPFENNISFQLVSPIDGMASVTLVDEYGRLITQFNKNCTKGLNAIQIHQLGTLRKGVYILKVKMNDQIVNKMVIKMN